MNSKLQFSKFKKFVSGIVFGDIQLTQISLNFETSCNNLKIGGLGAKLCGFSIILFLKGIRGVEGTSSVAFEVLIINCEIDFMNLFIFSCLTSHVNLFILFDDVKFFFSQIFVIFRKHQRTADYRRAYLVSDFKLTRENYDLLSSRHK